MTHFHASIIIAIMFATLLGWNFWHMFFSKQPIFTKTKKMTTKIYSDESERDLRKKLKSMEAQREELIAEVTSDYNADKLRALNILDHHILVANERLSGEWTAGMEESQCPIISSAEIWNQ